jgi:hypothetical protein
MLSRPVGDGQRAADFHQARGNLTSGSLPFSTQPPHRGRHQCAQEAGSFRTV